ncbi:iron-containing alcohol dehydrogenase [Amycolatopsis acidicola]|uniref:Iron-containing alcohol dehydrogenase n=1 Tax=Amycolatopsis acidicola TaxID=2596893 RepID=A0A5N0V1A7_9PSEU|nr:iron-containing alcohol dehydrogenase [Amycolatopsis acidicola]KAA9159611.1 iron-containing alcohol dehydrogenase [Amycolatopsis acidicola]
MLTEPSFFQLVPEVHYGRGVAASAGGLAKAQGIRHALVVTDPGVLGAGVCEPVLSALRDEGVAVTVFSDLATNPSEKQVAAAAEAYVAAGCDGVLGVGGGSSMDVAKCAATVVASGGADIREFEDGARAPGSPVPPLVLVPTTSGTGSEVVAGAIITDSARVFKMHVVAVPAQVALCDPELTAGLPPGPTAASGIDALAHAIGAYTSSERQPLTDGMALYAISVISRWLPVAVADGADLEAREWMTIGSLAAGISMKGGGAADHAFAHAVNALFDVHHGVGVGLFLAEAMEFNLPYLAGRLAAVARAMGVADHGTDDYVAAKSAVAAVRELVEKCGIPGAAELGVREEHIGPLVAKVLEDGFHLGLNPVALSTEDIRRVVAKVAGEGSR